MNNSDAISLENVFFSYEKTPVLENASFSIKKGEFVGIFGPNGGGKTTLLKLLTGLLLPDRGRISLLGKSPKDSRSLIGYVPQISKIDRKFPITTEEVVQMGCLSENTFWGRLPKRSKQKALDCLDKVGMLDKKNAPFGTLSGGQAQRVLIARSLASDPLFLFLDEPTAGIDPVAQLDILAMISSLAGTITVFMVTHDLQTIIEKVGTLLCVHRHVHTVLPSEACQHYGLGLYHSPLLQMKGG